MPNPCLSLLSAIILLCTVGPHPLWAQTTLVFTANTYGEHSPCPT